jgi:hypothetical protein
VVAAQAVAGIGVLVTDLDDRVPAALMLGFWPGGGRNPGEKPSTRTTPCGSRMLITVLSVSAPSRAPCRQIRATTASTWSL